MSDLPYPVRPPTYGNQKHCSYCIRTLPEQFVIVDVPEQGLLKFCSIECVKQFFRDTTEEVDE